MDCLRNLRWLSWARSPLLQKGDKIGVFEGGRTPFVIRQIGSNIVDLRRRIGLVEERYVAGLMRREIFDKITIWGWCSIVLV
jgi:hypothetical protein